MKKIKGVHNKFDEFLYLYIRLLFMDKNVSVEYY